MAGLAPNRILDPDRTYTFSEFFSLPYTPAEILSVFGFTIRREQLNLPTYLEPLERSAALQNEVERNLRLVNLLSETARREALVAPILLTVCEHLQTTLNIEYAVKVNNWLRGTLDYYIQQSNSLLVIEAKQADLTKGFVQLAVELIALDQWIDLPVRYLYGAVTTGEVWRFGKLDRQERSLIEDSNLYQVPKELELLLRLLIGCMVINTPTAEARK